MTTAHQLLNDPGWVAKNSRWRFWTWTLGFFNWVAFLWIAYRGRRPAWAIYGLAYSVPFILAMMFADSAEAANETVMDTVVVPLTLIGGVVGIFHARHLLPHYLARRAALEATPGYGLSPAEEAARMLHPAPSSHTPPPPPPPPAPDLATDLEAHAAHLYQPPAAPRATTDVNTAPEGELAALPGVGPILAKRAIDLRSQHGGFTSIDAFGDALGLKPHTLERLRPHLTASAPKPQQRTGRRVDY